MEERTAELGDERVGWICERSDVFEARRENLFFVWEEDRGDVRPVRKIVSVVLSILVWSE